MKHRRNHNRKRSRNVGLVVFTLMLAVVVAIRLNTFEFYSKPDRQQIASPAQTEHLSQLSLSSADDTTISFGRDTFYRETFGNEVLFTDIMGVFNGAFTIPQLMKATLKLHGKGTHNLVVEAAKTVQVGGRTFQKGERIETGLDVAAGSYLPIGFNAKLVKGEVKIGISCIACHAVYDESSKKVIEGVPNSDINVGTIVALATNSAAFFTHTDVANVQQYMSTVTKLPNKQQLEQAVDEALLKWPRGYADVTVDKMNNPVQIPDVFTKGDYPYNWTGYASVGPMHGLVFMNGIPHGQNMDPLTQVKMSPSLFNLDSDTYMGIMLQNAANKKYRYRPTMKMTPTQFFATVDPTPGVDGVNEVVPTPNAPQASFVSPVGMIPSLPGYKIGEHLIAMAAYENSLHPTKTPIKADEQTLAMGREVFVKANCISCHAGPFATNNRVIPQEQTKTEPSRALGMKELQRNWGDNWMYDWQTNVPLPSKPQLFKTTDSSVPIEDQQLSIAAGSSKGGYKVPSLYGLYWSAPYLHDGGVAVGAEGNTQLGVPGTLYNNIAPDSYNSLRALLDRQIRSQVVEANAASEAARAAHVSGEGHEHWVDEEAGFTKEQQAGLIYYLLKLTDPQ